MVNRGRPSKGCQTCRERKIKCDQIVTGCSQCKRIKFCCPGYRDELDLLFRNQTHDVVRRVREQRQAKSRKKAPSSQGSDGSCVSSMTLEPLLSRASSEESKAVQSPFLYTIGQPAEEHAIAFFVSHYVVDFDDFTRGHLEYLPSFLSQPNVGKCLLTSVQATGLAGLSNVLHSPDLMGRARAEYVSAIQLTNAALRSPQESREDSTLLSVMLLGMYEMITHQDEQSVSSWANHINGSVALLKLRGREHLYTLTGIRIFQQVTIWVLANCMYRGISIPPEFLDLRKSLAGFINIRSFGWVLAETIMRFASHMEAMKKGALSDPCQLVEIALEIDRHLLSMAEDHPQPYEVVPLSTPSKFCYGNYYHIYPNLGFAHRWNMLRIIRIYAHQVILKQLLRSSASTLFKIIDDPIAQYGMSISIIEKLSAEICASVPQHLGLASSTSPQFHERIPMSKNCAGYHFVVWPLSVVGHLTITTEDRRLWVADCLDFIADSIGMRQATVIATGLRQKQWFINAKQYPDLGLWSG